MAAERSRRRRIGAFVSASPLTPGPYRDDDEAAGARAAGLIAVAEDLAGEFSLRPLLERILLRCTELLGCDAGSICSVDEAAGTYRKEADIGIACQSGHVFPLTEGMTGAVVARRGPIWFARYSDVRGGHVAPDARATLRGVIGVPLEWRGRIIGACIPAARQSGWRDQTETRPTNAREARWGRHDEPGGLRARRQLSAQFPGACRAGSASECEREGAAAHGGACGDRPLRRARTSRVYRSGRKRPRQTMMSDEGESTGTSRGRAGRILIARGRRG